MKIVFCHTKLRLQFLEYSGFQSLHMTILFYFGLIISLGTTSQEIFEYSLCQMLRKSLCSFKFKHKFGLKTREEGFEKNPPLYYLPRTVILSIGDDKHIANIFVLSRFESHLHFFVALNGSFLSFSIQNYCLSSGNFKA